MTFELYLHKEKQSKVNATYEYISLVFEITISFAKIPIKMQCTVDDSTELT